MARLKVRLLRVHTLLTMNALASRFRPVSNNEEQDSEEVGDALWGSQAGFGNLKPGAPPEFMLPNVANVCALSIRGVIHSHN